MEYKKVENEIDTLLKSDGLNAYERKLLRKTKEKFSKVNCELKAKHRKMVNITSELNMKERKINNLVFSITQLRHYFLLNILFLLILITGLLIK